jgi:hypothetical protein
VRPPSNKRRVKGKRCTLYVKVGSWSRRDGAGANTFRFSGRIARRALPRGYYRLQATPLFGGRTGLGAAASFRIIA